ncbi:MAG: pyrroline-5-carboxylate reductase [Candidatus Firestonebacteria bacterium]
MKIGFLGAGNMAEAIIKGILKSEKFLPEDILISDIRKEKLKHLTKLCKVNSTKDNIELIKKSKIIVVAVKPKDIHSVLSDLKNNVKKDSLIVSIVAGISINYIEKSIDNQIAVIRIMPNTPALVCAGVSAISLGKYAKSSEVKLAKGIFQSIGKVVEVDEKFMDVVTAISGSGPAYVFLFMEYLAEAGMRFGLKKEIAEVLAFNTFLGASKMVLELNEKPDNLREKVTSPGGTTIEALKVFESKGLKKIIEEAVSAAANKSKELTKK